MFNLFDGCKFPSISCKNLGRFLVHILIDLVKMILKLPDANQS